MVEQLRLRGITDERVLAAFAKVPREAFVSPEQIAHAYDDVPLPIGGGQTISQPLVVAMMAQAMALRGHERVLEVGTGSGYAAAILACLAARVDTIERLPELADRARPRLPANVHLHVGDGSLGLPELAPFDAILVSAAAPSTPPALLAQLAIGGRLVLPVGPAHDQQLACITRTEAGHERKDLGDVRFVPLVGAEGWPR